MKHLQRVIASMQAAAAEAGIQIVAGDTKVVQKGKADGMYITTAGIGVVQAGSTSAARKPSRETFSSFLAQSAIMASLSFGRAANLVFNPPFKATSLHSIV